MLGGIWRAFLSLMGLFLLLIFWPVGLGLLLISAISGRKKEVHIIKG